MKKVLLFIMLVVVANASFSQKTTDKVLSKHDYLKKSKNQRTWGWALLSAGAGGIILDLVGNSVSNDMPSAANFFPEAGENTKKDKSVDGPVIAAGLLAMAGSMPLFLAADRNKNLAASVSIRNQPVRLPQDGSFVLRPQPALTLRIGFNK